MSLFYRGDVFILFLFLSPRRLNAKILPLYMLKSQLTNTDFWIQHSST